MNRGNILRNNVFKKIRNTTPFHLGATSVQAIYLDDQMSGWQIYNNTFIDSHVGMFIGGGRDNKLVGNHCPSTAFCVHVDNRGQNWMGHKGWEQNSYNINFAPTATLLVGWQAMMKYPAWQKAFPELKKITDPCTPVGNVVTGNDYASGVFIDQPLSVTPTPRHSTP